jgi:Zn-dependent protease with chaperone function
MAHSRAAARLTSSSREPIVATAVECPHCGRQLRFKAEMAGHKGKCPHCQKTFELQAPALAAAATTNASHATATAHHPKAPPLMAAPPPKLAAARAASQPAVDPIVVRRQVAEAFRGTMTPPRVGVLRKGSALLVLGILLLMPIVYVAVILGLLFAMYWLATSSGGWSLGPAIVWPLEAALALLFLCLLRPLLVRQRSGTRSYPVDSVRDGPLLELIAKVCEQINAPPPNVVVFECSPYVMGNRKRLSLGLPLVACMSIEQLAAIIAGQLALHRQHAGCAITNLIRGINGWLWQSVYGRGRFDQWLTIVAERPYFHLPKLLLPLRAAMFPPQVVLFVPMFVANTVAGVVVGQAELDADRAAARLIGRRRFGGLLERIELVEFSWDSVLAELNYLHKEQALPDNLPQQLAVRMLDASPEILAVLRETVNKPDDKPFDARASNPERLAAIESESDDGIVRCMVPASNLLADYDTVARQMTWDYYAARFGPQLLKTGLKPVATS